MKTLIVDVVVVVDSGYIVVDSDQFAVECQSLSGVNGRDDVDLELCIRHCRGRRSCCFLRGCHFHCNDCSSWSCCCCYCCSTENN